MEAWKSLIGDEGYFEKKLNEGGIIYNKTADIEVYDLGFNGGTTYDIYDYKMRSGQRVLLCVTTVCFIDDVSDQALLIKLGESEEYSLDEVKNLIKDYNSFYDKRNNILDIVYTFSEAAEKWQLSDGSVLRNAVRRGKFNTDEYRQSGQVWLVTREGMERVYGKRED